MSLRELLHIWNQEDSVESIGYADADGCFSVRGVLLHAGRDRVNRLIQTRQSSCKLLPAGRQLDAPFRRDQKLNSHLMLETPDSACYRRVAEFELLGGIIE
jgi:hypothetical protein